MSKMHYPVVIIGAGLTGLTAAYHLQKAGIAALLLEARSRLGGRIYTKRTTDGTPIEMGATWLGQKHLHLTGLLEELGIGIEPQQLGSRAVYEPMSINPPQLVQLPPNPDPSYRIVGGSSRLIEALAETLAPEQIQLNTVVKSIRQEGAQWRIETEEGSLHATGVITTLPPKLLVQSITFQPALPAEWVAIAEQTHTWMGESIKIGLSFPDAFWQRQSSGTVFSNVGPVSELYDHTSSDGQHYALKGFLNAAYHSASREERRQVVMAQLRRYYGDAIDSYSAYEDLVWRAEPFTFHPYTDAVLPHQHNGHEVFQGTYFADRLLLAGSETAPRFPGYMDGAVYSGWRAANRMQKALTHA